LKFVDLYQDFHENYPFWDVRQWTSVSATPSKRYSVVVWRLWLELGIRSMKQIINPICNDTFLWLHFFRSELRNF